MYKILLFLFIPLLCHANDSVFITKNHNKYVKGKLKHLTIQDYVDYRVNWSNPNAQDIKNCQYIIIDGDTFNYIDNYNKEQGPFINILICESPSTKEFQKNKNCLFTKEINFYKNATFQSQLLMGCDSFYKCDTILWQGNYSEEYPFVVEDRFYQDSIIFLTKILRDSSNQSNFFSTERLLVYNRYNGIVYRKLNYSKINKRLFGNNYVRISDKIYLEIFSNETIQNYLFEFKYSYNDSLIKRFYFYNNKLIKEEAYNITNFNIDKNGLKQLLKENMVLFVWLE